MTITPVNDFSPLKHNELQKTPAQENPAARAPEKGNSGDVLNGRVPVDSVEFSTAAENLASADSQLADFDQAQGALSRLQNSIYQQAGLALQAQANITPETAIALLSD